MRKEAELAFEKKSWIAGGRRTPQLFLGLALLPFVLGCPEKPPEDDDSDTVVECPEQIENQDLRQPRVIRAVGGVLDTSLVVRKVTHDCIPVYISQNDQGVSIPNPHWEWRQMELRSYGSPKEGSSELEFTVPGPTFRVNKEYLQDPTQPPGPSNPTIQDGSRFKVLLKNELPNNSYPYDKCDPATVRQPPPPGPPPPGEEFEETFPECFHGADVTNLHYHGTHVSPQPHQDFVLLALFSAQQTNPPPPPASETVAIGEYQTDINPFPWNQAPGTHWYHPHKHGSTALQVLNGMAGALLIEGEFDDWLYGFYGVDPADPVALEAFEKVLVVGQTWTELNFFKRPHPNYPPYPLVNGQAIPTIKMKYGEVQRWRFIGATMQSSAQLTITFPSEFQIKQIAQDGVQFASENYDRQPLGNPTDGFNLAPGNRIDVLIQAPAPSTEEGVAAAGKQTFYVRQKIFGHLQDELKQQLLERASGLRTAMAIEGEDFEEALFRIDVESAEPMPLPTPAEWPPTPYYLRGIDDAELTGTPRELTFSMTDPDDGTVTTPGVQPNGFWINGQQYDPECANETMKRDTAEEWTINNDSAPRHPFHIHINPFQLRDSPNYPDVATNGAPYPWMDTIALPAGSPANVESVVIRHRFEDYTGAYVIHCHFLGHEDRGMMQNVQTVCSENEQFGTPQEDGGADDCAEPAPVTPNPFPGCGDY